MTACAMLHPELVILPLFIATATSGVLALAHCSGCVFKLEVPLYLERPSHLVSPSGNMEW